MRAIAINMSAFAPINMSVTISETIDEEHGPQWQRARAFLAISMSMSENFWCPVHGALVLNVETELADTAAIFQSVVAISSFVSLTKGDLVAEHQDFHYLSGYLAS
jgi:hypothetical protein